MKNNILNILNSCGIKNVGFCDFDLLKDMLLDCRAKSRLPLCAKTVIVCAFSYKVGELPPHQLSRYAAVPDYHTVCGDMLKRASLKLKEKYPQNSFEHFCDNSPIPEVFAAATAGLGVKGDNGLLLTKDYGSFVFLGEIITDLNIDTQNQYAECCHCGACKAACPVGLNKQGCLSHISQKKKLTDTELSALKQNNILWGCDICAEVCPYNKQAKSTDIVEFINGYRTAYNATDNHTDRAYNWRGEAVIGRNFENLAK